MAQRHLVIERPVLHGKHVPIRIGVQVDDRAAIGPWVATLAARLGYPLVDTFGSPLTYRLRSVSGEQLLPTTGRFAEARFSSGSRFILEPVQSALPKLGQRWERRRPNQTPLVVPRFSRRALLSTGILTTFSLLGFGSGMTTAFAQRLLLYQPRAAIVPVSIHSIFRHHQQTVRTVTWAPDGSMIASGGNDGVAFLWNVDGTVLHTLQLHASVRALAWSPDGVQLIAGAANRVTFFDVQTGAQLAENVEQHRASVTSLGWTQGQGAVPLALSAGADARAVVWNGKSHQTQVVFRQHTAAIEALAALTGTVVTVSEGGLARVWSALDGREIHGYYAENQQPLRSAAFSSRGNLVVGGDDGMLHVWRDGRTCRSQVPDVFGLHCVDGALHLQGHTGPVRAIASSPDGTLLATGGDDKKLIIWSLQKMAPLLTLLQQEALTALSWSPSGQFLAGALGSYVTLWQIQL